MNISHNWLKQIHMPEAGMLVCCSGYGLAVVVFLFSSVTAGVLVAIYATAVRLLLLRRNALERHLCKKIEIADCANNARGIFLSTMSHEIRTPMNAVIGMTELLRETALDTEQEMFAKGIHESATALMVIIDDILDFSKIDAGKLRLEVVDFPLYPLMDDCLAVLKNAALKKNLELSCQISPALPFALVADAGRLRQILLNLIGNAIKFTHTGKIIVRVLDKGQLSGNCRIRFEVEDTGIGISEQRFHSLFLPFTQVAGAAHEKYGGTGLGLSISKQLVELMGGDIGATSTLGKGSTFWFEVTLPKATERHPVSSQAGGAVAFIGESSDPAENCTGTEAAGDSTGPAGRDVSILLVEDNVMNQKVAIHQLNALGYTAQLAINGLDALAMLEQQAFDLILLDCQMPLMDGITLTRQIRLQEKTSGKHIKIVAMTANAMRGDRELCIDAGMDDYLTKPISRRLLLQVLQLHLPTQSGAIEMKSASINEVRMRDLFGEDTAAQLRVLTLFVETSRPLIQQLHAAITTGEKDKILSIAHRLKGSADNLGLDELAALCRAIETAIRAENYPHLDDLSICALDAFNTLEESVKKLCGAA